MTLLSKKIVAFNYFGGKTTWLDELFRYFPNHKYFVDLFCGSMSVTLNKQPSEMDTANDLNSDIYNFFMVLRNNPDELFRVISLTMVSREEYNSCFPINSPGISDVERARRFFVRCRMSFQGSGIKESTGFNACIRTSEKGISKNVSKYLSAVEKLPAVVQRLKEIQIENLDYREILKRHDSEEHFIYVDPPYELRKRKYKKWYEHEFEDQDHIDLSNHLKNSKSMIMVSHYKSEFYDELYKDWNYVMLPPRGHSMKNGKKTEECIWFNYPLSQTKMAQLNLF